MKIAVIGSNTPTISGGKAQSVLAELYPRLINRGHRVDLFIEREGQIIPSESGQPIMSVPSWTGFLSPSSLRSSGHDLFNLWQAYDVVHICASDVRAISALARLNLPRSVISILGAPSLARSAFLSRALARRGARAAARAATRLTVASKSLERHFRDSHGRAAIYIPNGITFKNPPDAAVLSRLDIVPDEYLLIACPIQPEKMISALFSALIRDRTQRKAVFLDAAGQAEKIGHLARKASLSGRILMASGLDSTTKDALFAHAYLFIATGQGPASVAAIGTALSNGAAVVVSDMPDHLDLIGEIGFSFTEQDDSDLHRIVSWLLADPAVVKAKKARSIPSTAGRLGWDAIANRYERVLQSTL